ncbi:MarR family winged helix-turn-helix transcriptional regulator [Maribacter sp. 2307ULW6-5]|uniref:MarR family winged helix-turn-helix transcriptional regulator n=1 Tax=Maribacter sp. 2307ULW6-5 TaxID=3386275 RepID=UPI0039BC2C3D
MNVEAAIKTTKEIPLKKRTLIHLSLINNKINEQMMAALKPFDISLPQFNVLRILRGQQGKPANLQTINERMVTKMSNTTRLVDKLMGKGWVQKEICRHNRRKVEISITRSGLEELEKIDGIILALEDKVVGNFKASELQELNELLNKF